MWKWIVEQNIEQYLPVDIKSSMSDSGHGSGAPAVSLKRTYVIMLIVYGLAAVFALLAGAALTWHVDPYSECLLYSHPVGDQIEYGHEASEFQILLRIQSI